MGKALGEGMCVLGQRRNMCKGPEAAPPFVSPGASLLRNAALIVSRGLSSHRTGSS